MKQWYLFYTTEAAKLQQSIAEIVFQAGFEVHPVKLQRPVAELQEEKLQRPVGELMKQPVSEIGNDASNEFPLPFALVPWGQHIEIITRSESLEEAFFYMQHVIEKGLSRTALVNCYKAHLYDHQGKIVNNFSRYLPEPQSHLVQEVLKVTLFFLNSPDCLYLKISYEFLQRYEKSRAKQRNYAFLSLLWGVSLKTIGKSPWLFRILPL